VETVCKRELATLFAHWTMTSGKNDIAQGDPQTQGLYLLREEYCELNPGAAPFCEYKHGGWTNDYWPSSTDEQYYGRGPFQLHWNQEYGQFSTVMGTSTYNSKLTFLEDPNLVHEDGYLAFASALWQHMTPKKPKPSVHDVVTGFFVPNSTDVNANIVANSFGTTINVVNGTGECGRMPESVRSQTRSSYYSDWLAFFELPEENDLGCGSQLSHFPHGSASNVSSFWHISSSGQCKPASWETPYSMYARDDYKRCVCDMFGAGEADCPTAPPAPVPEPEEEEEPEEEDGELLEIDVAKIVNDF